MGRILITIALVIFTFSPQVVAEDGCHSPELLRYIEQMQKRGELPEDFRLQDRTPEECKMLKFAIAKEQQDKNRRDLTDEELKELDILLRSKWNEMVQALAQKNIDKAASCFSDSSREQYRQTFLRITPQRYSEMVKDLVNARIKFVRAMGDSVEYDARAVSDGKEYSYFLLFVKDWNGEWKIMSF
jgi:hypothetical protein